MQTIRRLYLYAVAFVSLETVLWGAINLVRSFLAGELLSRGTDRLAGSLSLILVGAPVFLIHWGLAQRGMARGAVEGQNRVRAVFLYGALLATLIPAVQNTLALVDRGWLAAFGIEPWQAFVGGSQTWSDNLAALALNTAAAAYFYLVLRSDGRSQAMNEDTIGVRRLYRCIWLVYTLALSASGVQQVLQFILQILAPAGQGQQPQLANGLALLMIGLPAWLWANRVFQRSQDDPGETQSWLRLILLYALALAAAGGVLASLALVLSVVIQAGLGERLSLGVYFSRISIPVSVLLPAGAIWVIYSRALRLTILELQPVSAGLAEGENAAPDQAAHRQAGLRRLYFYVLGLLGLAAAFAGVEIFLGQVIGALVSGSSLINGTSRPLLANSLAMLLVGLPAWVVSLQPVQAEAAPETEAGDHARRSIVRRGALYLVLFAGVLGIMFSAGALLQRLLSALFGSPQVSPLLGGLQQLKTLFLFVALFGYHWQILRTDTRRAGHTLARRYAQFPVLVLAPDDEAYVRQVVSALEQASAGLPVAIHLASQGVPDETLSAARAVILPAELVSRPSEAIRLWLQGFDGARLVIPTPSKEWLWVFGSGRPLPVLARQAALMVRRIAEGEEPSAPQDVSPWIGVVYFLAGLAALAILFALVGFMASLIGSLR